MLKGVSQSIWTALLHVCAGCLLLFCCMGLQGYFADCQPCQAVITCGTCADVHHGWVRFCEGSAWRGHEEGTRSHAQAQIH